MIEHKALIGAEMSHVCSPGLLFVKNRFLTLYVNPWFTEFKSEQDLGLDSEFTSRLRGAPLLRHCAVSTCMAGWLLACMLSMRNCGRGQAGLMETRKQTYRYILFKAARCAG